MFHKLLALKDAYLADDKGATAIEYGLIAAGIALAIVTIVFTLGGHVETTFTTISDELGAAH